MLFCSCLLRVRDANVSSIYLKEFARVEMTSTTRIKSVSWNCVREIARKTHRGISSSGSCVRKLNKWKVNNILS